MKKLSQRGEVFVYEFSVEDGDLRDALACDATRKHKRPHYEKESAEAFLNHLYDHRLKDNLVVCQQAIDVIYGRIKAGRRYGAGE